MKRLNLGCGHDIRQGWLNLDVESHSGVDIVANLDNCAHTPIPLSDNEIDEFLLSHILEHIKEPLPLMQELHRIAKPNATAIIRTPHGASDDAYEDPTHYRQYFHGSFIYFSQPCYWRANYGYTGDWQVNAVELHIRKKGNEDLQVDDLMKRINTLRNQVLEMVVTLTAIKPVRAADRSLQRAPDIRVVLLD